jgi:hypothetical protein
MMDYLDAKPVTPHATNLAVVGVPWVHLYVGGAGNLNVVTEGGTTVLLSGVPAGTVLRLRVRRVLVASTTATLITALVPSD